MEQHLPFGTAEQSRWSFQWACIRLPQWGLGSAIYWASHSLEQLRGWLHWAILFNILWRGRRDIRDPHRPTYILPEYPNVGLDGLLQQFLRCTQRPSRVVPCDGDPCIYRSECRGVYLSVMISFHLCEQSFLYTSPWRDRQ